METLNLDNYPGAVKVIAAEGATAEYLADLSVHRKDLELARGAFAELNAEKYPPVVCEPR